MTYPEGFHILHPPSWVMKGRGGIEPFSEGLYSRYLGEIAILGGNWYFGWG